MMGAMGAGNTAKSDALRVAAIATIALAVPLYSALTYDVNGQTSSGRWLAVHILIAEIVAVIVALTAGWRPWNSLRAMPRQLKWALGLWLTGATIATVLADPAETSILFQAMWLLHILFALAIWGMFVGPWRDARRLLLLAFTAGLMLHSLGLYLVAYVIVGRPDLSFEFYSFGMSNPRLYVFIADALLGLGLGLFLTARSPRESLAFAVAIFAAYCLYAWSGGRASFGVSLLLPLLVVSVAGWHQWKALVVCYGSAAMAYPLSLLAAPDHQFFGFKSVLGRIASNPQVNSELGYSSDRMRIWTEVLQNSLEKPVFGHGQVFIPPISGANTKTMLVLEPHNAIVQIAYHWGLVGFVAVALAALPFLPTLKGRLRAEPEIALPAFAVLLALAISSMFDGSYFFTVPLFINAAMIAMLATVPPRPTQVGC